MSSLQGVGIEGFYCIQRCIYFYYLARKSDLENSLSEKQDFLSLLADSLAWLNQAEKHLKKQKSLGNDLAIVKKQHGTHQVSNMGSNMGALHTPGEQHG